MCIAFFFFFLFNHITYVASGCQSVSRRLSGFFFFFFVSLGHSYGSHDWTVVVSRPNIVFFYVWTAFNFFFCPLFSSTDICALTLLAWGPFFFSSFLSRLFVIALSVMIFVVSM